MIIKHNGINNNSNNFVGRKSNEILLIKDSNIYKFSSKNLNSSIVINSKLNLHILTNRDNELKELPSNDVLFYDKIIVNGVVIFENNSNIFRKLTNYFKTLFIGLFSSKIKEPLI